MTFENYMEAFTLKQRLEFINLLDHLEAGGFTVDDVRKSNEKEVERINAEVKRQYVAQIVLKTCEMCQSKMNLYPVNINAATQTGDPSDKSVWFCPRCKETIFNNEDIKTIKKRRLRR